jgi:NAD(P)-dependent dehydrogenase (short-subunit alcohol dehydrogenase family)
MTVLCLIAVGYVLGSNNALAPDPVAAQDAAEGPSEDAIEKISLAYTALRGAVELLTQEDRYKLATKGINTFAITSGGVNAVRDLESGRGVDPETFAALYAGQATDVIAEFLDRDEQGRLRYKNKVIRMYPIAKLKALYKERLKLSGEDIEG